jgi:hypothetical protein
MESTLGEAILQFLKEHPEKYNPKDVEKLFTKAPTTEAVLKFNLTDHESRRDFEACVKAIDFKLALWEIRHNVFRNVERQLEMKDADVFDAFQQEIGRVFEEHNISPEDLD